ncbi:ATPase [Ruminococcus sp. Marseille-P6503]|uniref:ATPase n=1 Tax=Ruminococcus sp. Marseille-P6503 TaxID=2364796 RepID=UPI000F52903D|nr:ATPase [Ruminococcus sp. Marseille-P6503]
MSEVYFLGAMTSNGFSTEFGKVIEDSDMFTYILKGGAGTGKSSLMKKAANYFEKTEHVERYYCSSDPNSLDAVVLGSSKVAIVDGTSPHVFDPLVPGVSQKIINLGDYWNEEMLKENGKMISEVTAANKSMLARAKRFTNAVSNIYSDTYQIGSDCIISDKLDSFIERFKKKILGKKGSGTGLKKFRQLTALTEYGFYTFTETLDDYFDIYYMSDDYFAVSNYLISVLADEAAVRGYDVTICPNQMFNNTAYEHMLIPELGVALVSGSSVTEYNAESGKPLNLTRFYDKKLISQRKIRLKMNKAACKDLTDEAVRTIKTAKEIHDEIERYYISSMDFDKINSVTENIIREIESENS